LSLGLAVAAFVVVAVSSHMGGALPMSVVTRGIAAFVVFGVFGLVALRGLVLRVITELARQAEEKRRKQHETELAEREPDAAVSFTE
jgi:hypothetical protein